MNPFNLKFNFKILKVTGPNDAIVRMSLTKGSWAKLTFWSIAPSVVFYGALAAAAARMSEKDSKENLTEDTTMEYPNHTA